MTSKPGISSLFRFWCWASASGPAWSPITSGSRPAHSPVTAVPTSWDIVPRDASVVAYANVQEIMASELRQQLRAADGREAQENGQQEFQEHTGINIETDIDHVVGGLTPADRQATTRLGRDGAGARPLRRSQNRSADARARRPRRDYKGKRLIVADHLGDFDPLRRSEPSPPPADSRSFCPRVHRARPRRASAAPTLVTARDRPAHRRRPQSAATNEELDELACGRSTAATRGRSAASTRCTAQANCPEVVANQLPPITWFAVSGHDQRRAPRHAPRRSARRRVGQQPARRRPRVPRARQAPAGAKPELQHVDAVARARRHRQDRVAVVRRARASVRRARRGVPQAADRPEPASPIGRVFAACRGPLR